MLLSKICQFGCLFAVVSQAQAQVQAQAQSDSDSISVSRTRLSAGTLPPDSHTSYSSGLAGSYGSMANGASIMEAGNTTSSATTTSAPSVTLLRGTNKVKTASTVNGTVSGNATASSTSSPQPTNTTPCNNYPEFCSRKYSNITMVSAHNSPFLMPNNIASNQELSVAAQLDDGIRALQVQTHLVNGTMFLCHSGCNILNAGTLTSYLTTVTNWVQTHPYDVITIFIANGDYVTIDNFVLPIQASGINQYAYTPPKIPMTLDDWPTLSSMILAGQRVIMFLDYWARPKEVPWILDEFENVWETPFDPTNRSFPCTVQRPPSLSANDTKNRLYMMNHNLNQEVSLLGNTLLIPLKPLLPVTNNVSGYGSLGESAETCYSVWGRAPNFLNVDYYNNGSGSVFEVAAKWNNVTYDKNNCCGLAKSKAEKRLEVIGRDFVVMAMVVVSVIWLPMVM